jgi:hypothetical protein
MDLREQFRKETGKGWVSNRTKYMEWLESRAAPPDVKANDLEEVIRILTAAGMNAGIKGTKQEEAGFDSFRQKKQVDACKAGVDILLKALKHIQK